ncbi:MAG: hypothetical protein Q9227_006193 [Pyrenula ochraceoflavens]
MPSLVSPPRDPNFGPKEDEDDYLSMTFTDTTPSANPRSVTSLHKSRVQRAETLGRPKSKAALAAEAEAKREEGLNTRVDRDAGNKGLAMMQKLGWKSGEGLGKRNDGERDGEGVSARLDPLMVEIKEGKAGIGVESEKRKRVRDEAEKIGAVEKKAKVEEGDYRERVAREREERRSEGQIRGAMSVLCGLDEEAIGIPKNHGEHEGDKATVDPAQESKDRWKFTNRPLKSIPVLYRGLIRQRRREERDRRMKNDIQKSLPRRQPVYEDSEEDDDDKLALPAKDKHTMEEVDDAELDEEDEDLENFEELQPHERLERLVMELREKWRYCFWCKWRYKDAKELEEECPGVEEDLHG